VKRRHSSSHKDFHPETLALGFGYDPQLSEGAVKPPVFLTSTFEFASAREGKRYFELAYGLRQRGGDEREGLIYSRINNPNLQMFEERLAAWDHSEQAATFASGMAAISTVALALLEPGAVVLATAPLYGGTHHLFTHVLKRLGIECRFVPAGNDIANSLRLAAREVGESRVGMVFVETPANPSLVHTDIAACAAVAAALRQSGGRQVPVVVDNTLLGPLFQRPIDFGADLVVYSATKFLGGHSDLVAGVATGSRALMEKVRGLRAILGTVTTPFHGWLLQRSLETVSVRMRRQAKSARRLAQLLSDHPRVKRVHFPGLAGVDAAQHETWARQCTGTGSIISFEVEGDEEAAFEVLDRMEVFRLAVSLGGTESLAEHPMSMTHADVSRSELEKCGVTAGMVRLSVGLEHVEDLARDLQHALQPAAGLGVAAGQDPLRQPEASAERPAAR
jgi:methionine-gamma-lyase